MKLRLSLDALAVLDAIERKGSFSAAAAELHRVPSAVTYQIRKLEQELGTALFDRAGHRARLTAAGETLLAEGRHLLRAAGALERKVQQVAAGWETELHIAVGDLIPLERLYPLIERFYREQAGGTRLRLMTEVYGGCWDALVSGRADLAIGAPGEGPPGGGYASRPLAQVNFVFVVAPDHPLAERPEPLGNADILAFRAVTAADSSRNLPPRTSGLLSGQDLLTVPDMPAKQAAHRAGLGVGYLPDYLARADVEAGRLKVKAVEEGKAAIGLVTAWCTGHRGRALQWFLRRLEQRETVAALFA